MFDAFISVLQNIVSFFYNLTVSMGIANYGVAIILMTLVIKMLLYPLTVKQVRSMKAMQEMQPRIKEIQEKYKKDPERMQREMSQLYKEAGTNPLSGCLPILLQMPILIGIFYALRDFDYIQQPSFLWMADLAQPDPFYVLPVLSALSTYVQSKQTTTDSSAQSKMMVMFMPVFIGYISLTFPAGLVLYWVVSNLAQILQQAWMNRTQTKS